jgi:hypothetical protein
MDGWVDVWMDVDGTELPQERSQWKSLVYTVMDLRLHEAGCLGRRANISFSVGDTSGCVLALNCNV